MCSLEINDLCGQEESYNAVFVKGLMVARVSLEATCISAQIQQSYHKINPKILTFFVPSCDIGLGSPITDNEGPQIPRK